MRKFGVFLIIVVLFFSMGCSKTSDKQPKPEIGKKEQGTEIWSGKGDFTLTDFSKLTKFLSSLMSANEIHTWSKNAK